MKTYRIDSEYNGLVFECNVMEEETNGKWHVIKMKNYPKYFLENDWVYFDDKGELRHIDELAYKPVINKLKKIQKDFFNGNTMAYFEYVEQKAIWKDWLQNPILVEDEIEYAKRRGLL